jgi:hypothetical protein
MRWLRSKSKSNGHIAGTDLVRRGNAVASRSLDTSTGPSKALSYSMKLTVTSASDGNEARLTDLGYWGFGLRPDTTYSGSLYAPVAWLYSALDIHRYTRWGNIREPLLDGLRHDPEATPVHNLTILVGRAVMTPDIAKIDPDRNREPGLPAWNFSDEMLRRLLHGNSLSASKDMLIPFLVSNRNASRETVTFPLDLTNVLGAPQRGLPSTCCPIATASGP